MTDVPFDLVRPEQPRTGAQLLDDVATFIGRYLVLPTEHALTALALWAAHTHAADQFYVTPRLVLDSAEPESGKTRVLELLRLVCCNPKMSISVTTAALYRRIALGAITVLLDEADAIFAPKSAPQNEDLRALLNSGYKRGATVDRCVGDGKNITVQEFPVFAPVALAGLAGRMPATITTRAVTIHMRRRAPGEHVDPFSEQDAEVDAEPLREQLAAWADSAADDLGAARPDMPAGVVDRPAEIWRALIAVADAAGDKWPGKARAACSHYALNGDPELSLGVRLLADLRDLFTRLGVDRLSTVEILAALHQIDEAPWADLYGKPLDARRLSRELTRYGVASITFRATVDGKSAKGYVTYGTDGTEKQTGLSDAWSRYLRQKGNLGNSGNPAGQDVTDGGPVTDGSVTSPGSVTGVTSDVTDGSVTSPGSVTGVTSDVTEITKITEDPHHCRGCGQRLLLPDGRTQCERCRIDADRRSAS